ncbi:hypothetical protein [Colletotrichum fructicola chrysovirus 1]|uniref:Uncharacterized protein n=1 Tax=Colletotrichum fructicola chrysovirus 1 TaxID=2304034 RepID=A0A346IME1_9VIRU|nr:hypothetical protein [Colletotrichum fructicola chrysovirus 1]AXP19676.1 hypothetical protein [Colletotrichum fructicola chrysovirus 1]
MSTPYFGVNIDARLMELDDAYKFRRISARQLIEHVEPLLPLLEGPVPQETRDSVRNAERELGEVTRLHECGLGTADCATERGGGEELVVEVARVYSDAAAAATKHHNEQSEWGRNRDTRIMRRGHHDVTPINRNLISMSYGLPKGADVRALAWTDADVSRPRLLNTLVAGASSLHKLWRLQACSVTLPSGRVLMSEAYPGRGLGGMDMYGFNLHEVALYLTISEDLLVDVSVAGKPEGLRVTNRERFDEFLDLCSIVQFWIVDRMVPISGLNVLEGYTLAQLKTLTTRTQQACTPSGHMVRGPIGALVSLGEWEADDSEKIGVSHCAADGTVSRGTLSPNNIPPGLLTVYATSGGKTVTGGTLTLRGEEGVYTVTSSVTANMTIGHIKELSKCAPTVRDGLFSPTAAGALLTDGDGGIYVDVNHEHVVVPTIFSGVPDGSEIEVVARNCSAMLGYLEDVAALQGWSYSVELGGTQFNIDPSEDGAWARIVVKIRYGPEVRPQWATIVAGELDELAVDSELRLDYGVSGLGRYLLSRFLVGGTFIPGTSLKINKRGRFGAIHGVLKENKAALMLTGSLPTPTNYVVDVKTLARTRGSETQYYAYAIGVAKFIRNQYVGSACCVDDSPELDEFLSANRDELPDEVGALLANPEVPSRDVTTVLSELRALESPPTCVCSLRDVDTSTQCYMESMSAGPVYSGGRIITVLY